MIATVPRDVGLDFGRLTPLNWFLSIELVLTALIILVTIAYGQGMRAGCQSVAPARSATSQAVQVVGPGETSAAAHDGSVASPTPCRPVGPTP